MFLVGNNKTAQSFCNHLVEIESIRTESSGEWISYCLVDMRSRILGSIT